VPCNDKSTRKEVKLNNTPSIHVPTRMRLTRQVVDKEAQTT
jgi:hypothetical protein